MPKFRGEHMTVSKSSSKYSIDLFFFLFCINIMKLRSSESPNSPYFSILFHHIFLLPYFIPTLFIYCAYNIPYSIFCYFCFLPCFAPLCTVILLAYFPIFSFFFLLFRICFSFLIVLFLSFSPHFVFFFFFSPYT